MKHCCFWTDLRMGVVAAGMFALTTSWTQIIAETALWWQQLWWTSDDPGHVLYSYVNAEGGAGVPQWPAGLPTSVPLDGGPNEPFATPFTSLGLFAVITVMDCLLFIFSLFLFVGIQMGKGGRGLVLSWLLFLSLHMAYEIAFVITWYMYWGMADVKLLFATPIILMFIYSVLKTAMNVGGVIVTVGYYRGLSYVPSVVNESTELQEVPASSSLPPHRHTHTNDGFYDAYAPPK